ncbi:unnamed protein product [Closterium sp. NIES-53]
MSHRQLRIPSYDGTMSQDVVPFQPGPVGMASQQNPSIHHARPSPSRPCNVSSHPLPSHDASAIAVPQRYQSGVAPSQPNSHVDQPRSSLTPLKLSPQPQPLPYHHDTGTVVPLQPKQEPFSPQRLPPHPDQSPSPARQKLSAQPLPCHHDSYGNLLQKAPATIAYLQPKQEAASPQQQHPHSNPPSPCQPQNRPSQPPLRLERPTLDYQLEFQIDESSVTDGLPFRPISLHSVVPSYVSLGCPVLDHFLRGGLRACQVTELVGEAASGKTQLCLQLALAVQAPVSTPSQAPAQPFLASSSSPNASRGAALYIYTDGRFPTKRLFQLANSSRFQNLLESNSPGAVNSNGVQTCDTISGTGDYKPAININQGSYRGHPCDHVFIKEIPTVQELTQCLEGELHVELVRARAHPIRLLIIDSIASLFRSEFDNSRDDMFQRTTMLFRIASALKHLADRYKIAVVVTNQVTASVDNPLPSVSPAAEEDGESRSEASPASAAVAYSGPHPDILSDSENSQILWSSGQRVVPALGLAWSHCINTRLLLSRRTPATFLSYSSFQTPRLGQQAWESFKYEVVLAGTAAGGGKVERKLVLVFSPYLPTGWVDFTLGLNGIVGAAAMGGQNGVGGSLTLVPATSYCSDVVMKPGNLDRGRVNEHRWQDAGKDTMMVEVVENSCRVIVPVRI